jgi:hypothetical protein
MIGTMTMKRFWNANVWEEIYPIGNSGSAKIPATTPINSSLMLLWPKRRATMP